MHSPPRPSASGLFITGTDTGVGKTHIGVRLCRALREYGLDVRVRKPLESGCARIDDALHPHDAAALHAAAGYPEPLIHVCPYRLEHALSPERAAALENRAIDLEALYRACQVDEGFVLVEGAGGFYSPLTHDALNADLAERLGLPVILVVPDRLGCINHTLLSLEAMAGRGLTVAAVVLNPVEDTDPGMMDNEADLKARLQQAVFRLAFEGNANATTVQALVEHLLKVLGLAPQGA